PEVLQQAGYRTGYFGKVHYGPERPGDRACPENHGFDESLYGLAGLSMGRLHYLHHSHAAADEYGEAAPAHGVDPLRENGREVECEQHLTVEHTDIGNGLSLMPMGAQPSPGGVPAPPLGARIPVRVALRSHRRAHTTPHLPPQM